MISSVGKSKLVYDLNRDLEHAAAGLHYQLGVSVQDLADLLQPHPKVRPDRLIHGRKKFSDDQPTTAFPGYLRKLELEVFRPELTDEQKLELLRASVTGEHAEKHWLRPSRTQPLPLPMPTQPRARAATR